MERVSGNCESSTGIQESCERGTGASSNRLRCGACLSELYDSYGTQWMKYGLVNGPKGLAQALSISGLSGCLAHFG